MDNFKDKFREEASEHISDIEKALLNIEENPSDKKLIEKVFRAMHSLKGGGAMFGFELLSEFTHDLETIYDLIRNNKLELTNNILTLTLNAVDHIKELINTDDDKQEQVIIDQHQQLLYDIKNIVSNNSDNESNDKNALEESHKIQENKYITYNIDFIPHQNILENGTNPLYMIDDLINLGDIIVLPDFSSVPSFDQLDVVSNYVNWQIILATPNSTTDIEEVFMFVEESAEIHINKIANGNLVKNKAFKSKLQEFAKKELPVNLDDIKKLATESGAGGKQLQRSAAGTKQKNANAISSIRVSSEKLDELMNLVSELVTTQARLALYAEQKHDGELTAISENVQKLSRQLRDIAFSVVLIPIETLITRFQRLVRDLSQELGKDIIFRSEGTETELDKTIIESLTDPLLHIIRNSIDHGIEQAYIREKAGKSPRGVIMLKSFYSGANVIIQISDDGAGIDHEKVKAKAIEKGLTTKDAVLSRKDIFDFLFEPGFSTATKVTDVSGRGVGMDVVRQQISKIRGEIEIDSEIGAGTTLTLKLPLTLSIIDGLLVKIDDSFFIIPLSAVEKIHAVEQSVLFKQFNDLVTLDQEQVPYLYLRHEFDMEKSNNDLEQVILIRYEEKKVGIVVDSIIGEYQAVLKPLGKHYKNQQIISGATILGDGTVALVLDTNKTVNLFALNS